MAYSFCWKKRSQKFRSFMVLQWWLIGCWILVIRIIFCSGSFFMKFKISYQFLIQIPLNISTESGMEKLILSPKQVCSWIQVLGMPKRQRRISTLSTFTLLSSNQGFSLISWCCSLHFHIFCAWRCLICLLNIFSWCIIHEVLEDMRIISVF